MSAEQTPMDTDAITRERFRGWREVLARHNATPVVLVAVGHEHASGEVHVVTVEDLSTQQVVVLLAEVLDQLTRKWGGNPSSPGDGRMPRWA